MKRPFTRQWKFYWFFISVLFCFAASGAEASITLAWNPPTTNVDGTACTDLAGYKIYYDTDGSSTPYNGTGMNEGSSPITVPLSSLSDSAFPEFVISGLPQGITHYLAVTAYDTSNNESNYSTEITVVETFPPPGNDPPIASIGATPTQGMAPLTVSFSGTGTDTDGTVSSYSWTFGDGATSTAQSPAHAYNSPGTYTAALTVADNGGATDTDSVQIIVSAPPSDTTPPTVNITSPTTSSSFTTISGTITLGGSASDNLGISRMTCSNNQVGSGTASGSGNWSANIVLMPGLNTISITAYDAAGNFSSDSIAVTYNLPIDTRVTIFGDGTGTNSSGTLQDTYINSEDPAVNFSSRVDYLNTYTYPDNTSANHAIVKIDLSTIPNNATINSAVLSLYMFEAGGETEYELPIHKIVGRNTDLTVATWETYDGVNSWVNGGMNDLSAAEDSPAIDTALGFKYWNITSMVRDWAADTSSNSGLMITSDITASSHSYRYFYPSEYTDAAKRPKLIINYTIDQTTNTVPTANAGQNQTVTQLQLSNGSAQVTLDGSSSSDPEGSSLSYAWTQTQGSPVSLLGPATSNPFFSVTADHSGETLVFQLVVSDGQLESLPDSVNVVIEEAPPPNEPPTVSIGATPTEGMAPLTVSFSGTGTDTDGTVTDYTWSFGDGSSANVQNPSHIFTDPGTFTATLTVTDNDGAQGSTSMTIRVSDPPPDPDLDSDQDGISDLFENEHGLNPDTSDSDMDGISDFFEWGSAYNPLDTDGDTIIDALDTDSDNDGKLDSDEGTDDSDADGALNYIDSDDTDGPMGDQDQDGIINSTEVTYLINPNLADSDGDEIDDGIEFGTLETPSDSDADGLINALDTDSDNDGKTDREEGVTDDDGDGALNYIDNDDTDGPMGDQDQDGFTNEQETIAGLNPNLSDSDQDGIADAVEVGDINQPADTDGDGVIDAIDKDADNDGIPDQQEAMEDIDGNGLADRLDAATATFDGKNGKMALKLMTSGCRLSESRYLPEPISTNVWKPSQPFSFGGIEFKIHDVPVGGSVDVQIINNRKFHKRTQYWKFEESVGYYQWDVTVSDKTLTFTLTDGGGGDCDHTANGIILDPGFVYEPEEDVTAISQASESSSGGGGCSVTRNVSGIPDGVLLILPVLLLLILKRMRKI